MVNSNSSGTTKRRKKRQSLIYKTPKEKRRAKTVLSTKTAAESISVNSSENNGSDLTIENPLKDVDDSREKHSLSRRSVRQASVLQTEKVKSSTKRKVVESGPSGYGKKDSRKTNVGTSDDPVLTSTKDAEDFRKIHSLSTKPVIKNAPSPQLTKRNTSLTNNSKRSHDQVGEKTSQNSNSSRSKKAKKSDEPSSCETSTKNIGSKATTRQRKSSVIPDRIKDLHVTKKVFGKWKPLTKSTKEFTDEILKSVVLNVTAVTNAKDEPCVTVLTTLKDRVLERLTDLKAPYTQGDYRKMEFQNERSEELFIEKSREINVLDKRIEEEQRLLEIQSAKVVEMANKLELCKKELCSLDNEKVHPLIEKNKNVLNLPDLPQEFFDEQEELVSMEKSIKEEHLCQTVLQLREKASSLGLTKWMRKLTTLTQNLNQGS